MEKLDARVTKLLVSLDVDRDDPALT